MSAAARIMAAFVAYATSVGGLYVRLPEIQKSLGLGEAVYGVVLIAMPVGVLAASLTVPRLIERVGAVRLLSVALPLGAGLQIASALAAGPLTLAGALLVFGLVFGAINVTCNVAANAHQARTGEGIINRCHGWWAVGFLVASLLAAGCIRAGVPPLAQFMAHTILLALIVPFLVRPEATNAGQASVPSRLFAIPGRAILLIGAFGFAGLLMEGVTRSWAVIYARDAVGAEPWVAALALPAIVLTQTLGRFAGDGAVGRWGAVTVMRGAMICLFTGTLVFVLAGNVWTLILACLLIGAGISIVQPQCFSAAAAVPGRPASENVAAFATLSVVLGFLGPPVVGTLGELIGLRATFALVLPLPLIAWMLAWVVVPAPAAGGSEDAHA